MSKRERGRSGIYSTSFWLRLILKNRHRQKLRAHPCAYVLARARRPYLFAPRVLRFVSRLSPPPSFYLSFQLSAFLAIYVHFPCLALSHFRIRCHGEIYGRRKYRRIVAACDIYRYAF